MAFPKIDGYVVTEKLGSGSYSTVYKAYTKVGARSIVAIKCVDKSRVKNSGSAVDNLITEIRLLKTLTHTHIVHMKNFTWDDKNIYIIMEYCCGGDLSKYIHKYGRVPEKQVLYFLQQLASALKFLREKGVVHMDLKPHNLLLHKGSDGKYVLKVADFGFAQHMTGDSVRSVRGSPLYMAPEMLTGEYDERVDLWSVGVIMYECLFGRAPYSSNTFKELVDKIQRQAPIEIPSKASISPGCRELLLRLLQHDPNNRITYEEFFSNEYLDLQHMPSKENYEKAVTLIKRAIELDSSGQLEEAFTLYRDSLLYLVPCVGCETDSLRRAALAAKLSRYMERAEELKVYLKTGSFPQQNTAAVLISTAGNNCTSNTAQSRPTCSSCVTEPCKCSAQVNGTVEVPDNIVQQTAASSQPTNINTTPKSNRFGFKRLFGRQASIPYLDTKDSSITADPTQEKQKIPQAENNDGCRIT
ncbi:serine/threonine-protein kinase ULK3 isoform X1 [Helicoverpa zea]|uniref:serine/threonine-protein kinase ULK3 isoform X1 n=2 Tax=Helicoverpa zea TaxID=7113 RepID=UPI001F5A0D91|nr:serine/threonine-protein kinase ULK3 isoform X1 [Helicoverpa zea]